MTFFVARQLRNSKQDKPFLMQERTCSKWEFCTEVDRILRYVYIHTYWWVEFFLWVANFLGSSWGRRSWIAVSWCPKSLSRPTRMARKTPVKLKWDTHAQIRESRKKIKYKINVINKRIVIILLLDGEILKCSSIVPQTACIIKLFN